MKVLTLCEIPSAKGIIPKGQLIEIPLSLLEKLKGKVTLSPDHEIDRMEAEYFRLLKRAFELDDPGHGEEGFQELRGLVAELDTLYRELHRQGRKVPVRLPVERKAA